MSDQNVEKISQEENIRRIIAKNLVAFRKQAELTQQQLAEMLNYSDKAVSKWERAEGIPDIVVLKNLADIYGVTVNDFLTEHTRLPLMKLKIRRLMAKRWLITLLSVGLVWLIATVIAVVWLLVDKTVPAAKYAYLVAGPVSLIVLVVFCSLWFGLWQKCAAVSLLIWSLCVMINFVVTTENSWLIFIVGAALQLLVILWFVLRFFVLKDKVRKETEQTDLAEQTE